VPHDARWSTTRRATALGGALTYYGINDDFMKELAASLQPGSAALFVEIK